MLLVHSSTTFRGWRLSPSEMDKVFKVGRKRLLKAAGTGRDAVAQYCKRNTGLASKLPAHSGGAFSWRAAATEKQAQAALHCALRC